MGGTGAGGDGCFTGAPASDGDCATGEPGRTSGDCTPRCCIKGLELLDEGGGVEARTIDCEETLLPGSCVRVPGSVGEKAFPVSFGVENGNEELAAGLA
jgi:hypothetical protein